MSKSWWEQTALERDAEMREKYEYYYRIPPLPKWVRVHIGWSFGGAMARACFEIDGHPDSYVSTYLDTCDALGFMGKPYFEAYPIDGDTFRVTFEDQNILYRRVLRELKKMRRELKKEGKIV